MTASPSLDVKGRIAEFPIAELLVEIYQNRLSGSLRVSHLSKKVIVYAKDGAIAHAVSNQKEHRLFSIGLDRKAFDRSVLAKFPAFANDLELASHLTGTGVLNKQQLDSLTVEQIEAILISIMPLKTGEWIFSPHARLRADVDFKVNAQKLLFDYARCLPRSDAYGRFRSVDEQFALNAAPTGFLLQPQEKDVLSRFEQGGLAVAQLRTMCALSDEELFATVYSLWLGGFISRKGWCAAFRAADLDAIRGADLKMVNKAADMPKVVVAEPEAQTKAETAADPTKVGQADISLDDYLIRSETGETFYDLLGVDERVPVAEIKAAYLMLAKAFHPDRFHRETPEQFARIQEAFTKLAHAYETLRTEESRRSYDFKMRKELELREKRRKEGRPEKTQPEDAQEELGLRSFEAGLDFYQQEDYAAAATQLARAVHCSDGNALYHAYFGAAMSYLGDSYRHRAESELSTAVRLDPKNAKIRLMLVDFLIDMDLPRRAEGELKRFLEVSPGNREAMAILDRLSRAE